MTLHSTRPSPEHVPTGRRAPNAAVVVLDSPDGQLLPLMRLLQDVQIPSSYHQIDSPDTDLAALLTDSTVLVTESVHIRRSLLERLPELRLVVRAGIGVDIIDVSDARRLGIRVANVPDYCVQEVADHTILLLLGLVRQLDPFLTDVQHGIWPAPLRHGVRRMSKLVVGVVGLGSIGTEVVRRLRGFGCNVLVHDPDVTAPPDERVVQTTLEKVLHESDVITLHCPLTDGTKGLITAALLKDNPRRPFLVNVSRGELIDLEGIDKLLSAGQVRGAAVDVLPDEPWPDLDHPFVAHPQSLVTPHVAWWSEDAVDELNQSVFETIRQFIQTGNIPSKVEIA